MRTLRPRKAELCRETLEAGLQTEAQAASLTPCAQTAPASLVRSHLNISLAWDPHFHN